MRAGDAQETAAAIVPAGVPPLRVVRRLKGLTQQQLAQATGLTRLTVQRIEQGKQEPRPSTMLRIAQALGVQTREVDEFREDRRRRGEAP